MSKATEYVEAIRNRPMLKDVDGCAIATVSDNGDLYVDREYIDWREG